MFEIIEGRLVSHAGGRAGGAGGRRGLIHLAAREGEVNKLPDIITRKKGREKGREGDRVVVVEVVALVARSL